MRETALRSLLVALATLTLGACAAEAAAHAGASAKAAPQMTVAPAAVRPGASFRLRGSGFPADAHIALLAGSSHGPRARIGSAVTGRRGTFVAAIRVRSHAAAGAFVALACHDACRVQASVRFRIVRR